MNKETAINFYNKYKLYIFPAVVAASSLFLTIFAIYPQTVKLISNQKIQGELEQKSKILEVKAQTLTSFDESDLARKVQYALFSYPQERDFGNVIGLLQSIGAQSGFAVAAINLEGGTGKTSGAGSYNVRMEISGSKNSLPTLLSRIESSVRLMKILSLEVSVKGNQVVDAVVGVEVLFSPASASFGSLDSPLPQLSSDDEELLTRLATAVPTVAVSPTEVVTTPRGKVNPFE